jgi:hypothetical protein
MAAKVKPRTRKKRNDGSKPKCGLCGKTRKLTKTECCGQWICDDEGKYVIFSYARNSCSRNHRRFTLCGYHYTEEHEGILLKQRFMFITERMNITSRSSKILLLTYLPNVRDVE